MWFDIETGRIVGGEEAKRHDFPWQVAIMRGYDGLICGGSILSQQWAVSASHCFYECPEDSDGCNMDACPYNNDNEFYNRDYTLRFGEFILLENDNK